MTSSDSSTGKGDSDSAELPGDLPEGSESEQDAARRKFREALERKKFGHHGGGGAAADPRNQSPHASPAKPQRSFRRKSG